MIDTLSAVRNGDLPTSIKNLLRIQPQQNETGHGQHGVYTLTQRRTPNTTARVMRTRYRFVAKNISLMRGRWGTPETTTTYATVPLYCYSGNQDVSDLLRRAWGILQVMYSRVRTGTGRDGYTTMRPVPQKCGWQMQVMPQPSHTHTQYGHCLGHCYCR